MSEEPVRLRADARANRDAIVEAAAKLYADRSPVVPMADIAKAAGVGRATLARRFPTPESLRVAVLAQLTDDLADAVTDVPDTPQALATVLSVVLRQLESSAPLVDFVRSGVEAPTGAEPQLERVRELLRGPLRRAQEAGLAPSEIDAEDVRLVLFMASSAARSFPEASARERTIRLCRRAIGLTPGADDEPRHA